MTTSLNDFHTLKQSIIAWAADQEPIRAVILVGSMARLDHPADSLSDLDLILFTDDPAPYVPPQDQWIHQFGGIHVHIFEATGGGDPEYLVVYQGWRKVDFVFWKLDLLRSGFDRERRGILSRGYHILLDKDRWAAHFPPVDPADHIPPRPTTADFDHAVRHFWYSAYQAARYLRRRDLWMVGYSLMRLRSDWLVMAEWSMRATFGWDYDTWHAGRFINTWGDDDIRAALPTFFVGLGEEETWGALFALVEHFAGLASRTAEKLNLPYPTPVESDLRAFINEQYTQRNDPL